MWRLWPRKVPARQERDSAQSSARRCLWKYWDRQKKLKPKKMPCAEPCVTCVRPCRPQTSCTLAGEVTRTKLFCPQSDMLVHRTKPKNILASTLNLLLSEGRHLLRKDLPWPKASDIAGSVFNGRRSRFFRTAFCSIPSVIRKFSLGSLPC